MTTPLPPSYDAGRVIVLGSLNIDLTTRVRQHPRPGETQTGNGLSRLAGGKGANQAMAAARAGARVAMIGAVGSDEAGESYIRRLASAGVDVSQVRTVEGASGHALIAVSDAGENTIVVIPGANAEHSSESVSVALRELAVTSADVLLSVLEIPADAVAAGARVAHEAGARVVLNLAPYAELPAEVLALADPVVVNEHEAEELAASALPVASLLVTLGAQGARWDEVSVPGESLAADRVVNTTGAGDAFCGALAAALAAGATREQALAAGVAAGGAAVQTPGAQPDPEL